MICRTCCDTVHQWFLMVWLIYCMYFLIYPHLPASGHWCVNIITFLSSTLFVKLWHIHWGCGDRTSLRRWQRWWGWGLSKKTSASFQPFSLSVRFFKILQKMWQKDKVMHITLTMGVHCLRSVSVLFSTMSEEWERNQLLHTSVYYQRLAAQYFYFLFYLSFLSLNIYFLKRLR